MYNPNIRPSSEFSGKHEIGVYWLDKSFEVCRKICLKDFRQKIRAHISGQSLHPIRLFYPDGTLDIYTKYRAQTVIGLDEFHKSCKSGRIYNAKHLLLQGWGLKVIPEIVFKIKGLETLSLKYNQLHDIPVEISNLTALKNIILSYNQLTSLPDSIGELPSLESLSIGNNQISALPSSMSHLKRLKHISVRGTQITKAPEFFTNVKYDKLSGTIYL